MVRPSRALPNGMPARVYSETKPKTHIRGVPVEIVARIIETIYQRGYMERRADIDDFGRPSIFLLTFGFVDFYGSTWKVPTENARFSLQEDRAFRVWGQDWSCEMHMEPCFSGVVKIAAAAYNVQHFTMVNKRGWLRDMTIAQMTVGDF